MAAALAEIGDSRAVDPLIEMLDYPHDCAKSAAMRALVDLKGGDRAYRAIAKGFTSVEPDETIRNVAIQQLTRVGQDAVGALTAALDDDNPLMRSGAQAALQAIDLTVTHAPARATGKSFAKLLCDKDEDSLALLLVPKSLLPRILSPEVLGKAGVDTLYRKMLAGNTQRFIEFCAMCGDLSKMSAISFKPGVPGKSDFYASDACVLKDSFVTLAYANRFEITVKIEEMVLIDGKCYIVKID